jgi:hypothetical protein
LSGIDHDESLRTGDDVVGFSEGCPNCGEEFNAIFSTVQAKMSAPDEGEWCIWKGYFFIHEELKYCHDEREVEADTDQTEADRDV